MSMFDTRVAVIILAIRMDSTPRGHGLAARSAHGGHHRRVHPDLGRHLDTLFALASRHRIPSKSTGDFAMNKMLLATLLAMGLFVGILILLEVGRRFGGKRLAIDPRARGGDWRGRGCDLRARGTADRLYLLGAASRFDARRDLIVQETNAIGTAWLRLDLLPASAQPAIGPFPAYVDARLEVYRKLPDIEAARAELARATALQEGIWTQAVAAGRLEARRRRQRRCRCRR